MKNVLLLTFLLASTSLFAQSANSGRLSKERLSTKTKRPISPKPGVRLAEIRKIIQSGTNPRFDEIILGLFDAHYGLARLAGKSEQDAIDEALRKTLNTFTKHLPKTEAGPEL